MASHSIRICFFLCCLLVFIPPSDSSPKCQKSYHCGDLGLLEFPLTLFGEPECGLFEVYCASKPPQIQFEDGGILFEVKKRISTNRIMIQYPYRYPDYTGRQCLYFDALPYSPFSLITISPNLTVFLCAAFVDSSQWAKRQNYFQSYKNSTDNCTLSTLYYKDDPPTIGQIENTTPEHCSVVHAPVRANNGTSSQDLLHRLSPEFEVEWSVSPDCASCHSRGGRCLIDGNSAFRCKEKRGKRVLLIGGVMMTTLTPAFIFLFLVLWKKYTLYKSISVKKEMAEARVIEFFLNNSANFAPKRYKYSHLKKMTKSFTEKLGKGGYGSVYKGILPDDGRLVAVKVLSESAGNGDEFINEVASISRTSHVNIVALLGYCFEGSKRALIYEFMPNGSLEKFMQSNAASSSAAGTGALGWSKLFDIAIGTARGLEYLHLGCNMRILHFDIKPHNILLDKDFNPKISDFGLAKLCPNRSSIVSTLVARGTIGYIAPEVFCRNFGGVSHKSDVYSYGMTVLDMVVGRQIVDNQADHSGEMYFPDWIYKRLEVNSRMGFPDSITNEDEWQIARKMTIVGLWCIQMEPKNRPSMSKVVEMLAGNMDYLEIPPMSHVASPISPALYVSSTYEISTDECKSLLLCPDN